MVLHFFLVQNFKTEVLTSRKKNQLLECLKGSCGEKPGKSLNISISVIFVKQNCPKKEHTFYSQQIEIKSLKCRTVENKPLKL